MAVKVLYLVVAFFLLQSHLCIPLIPSDLESETEIVDYLKSELESILIESVKESNLEADHHDSFICKACFKGAKFIQDIAKLKIGVKQVKQVASVICNLALHLRKEVCVGAIDLYADSLLDGLISRYISPAFICTEIKLCQPHYTRLNHTEFAEKLLGEERVYHKYIEPSNETQIIAHVSDTHIDLKYKEGALGNCDEPLCCRVDSPPKKKLDSNSVGTFFQLNTKRNLSEEKKYGGKYGYLGDCDLPTVTLDLLFEDLMKKNPEMIFLTGDNVAHDTWKTTLEDALAATRALVYSVIRSKDANPYTYKNTIVYPVFGNHESRVVDQMDFKNSTFKEDFNEKYGEVYRPFLEHDPQAFESFKKNGFYTSKHKDTNLRVIGMNCYNCDQLNFFLIKNSTDPGDQYVWLEGVLRQAEKDNELVYIIGHITTGAWLPDCSKRFNALVDRFSHIIKGQFFGHSHKDEMKIIRRYFDSTSTSSIAFLAPSATTYGGHHPSYRLLNYNNSTMDLMDYDQYRMNLTSANAGELNWEIAYKFSDFYGFKNMSRLEDIKTKFETVGQDEDFTRKLLFEFTAWNNPALLDKGIPLKEDDWKGFKCRTLDDGMNTVDECAGGSHSFDSNDIIQWLIGKWYTVLED